MVVKDVGYKQNKLCVFLMLIVSSLIICNSCAVRSVYVPTSQNVFLYDSIKQLRANAYVGTTTAQLQLGVNPIQHGIVGASTNIGDGLSIIETYIGAYNYSKGNANWRYESLLGYGYTNNVSRIDNAWFSVFQKEKLNYETTAFYHKIFIQPSVGYVSRIALYKLNYSFSLSGRVSYIDFKKYFYREIDEEATATQGIPVYTVDKQFYNKTLYLFEPCITNKVGRNNLYAVLQASVMMPYSKEIDIRYTKFSPVFLFGVGIQYHISLKSKTKSL